MHIVIDGYNFIHRSRYLTRISAPDLQAGRDALVDVLAVYKKIKPYKITVVFDGALAPSALPKRDQLKGIRLRYSHPGELADTVIKRMAARDGEKLLVVSSDREVAEYAASRGAATIGAEAFEEKLLLARTGSHDPEENDADSGWRPTTRKKGPAQRLPKKRRRLERKLDKF